ncbi:MULTISPECIES: hypothetical protein [Streptosporangium]|uniref:Uncharacterized protein n=1 Tax=Streptosporangium brasiliense TaxID=47480 RepID=A0ABT9RIT4_9ACTN|nr:hypothetical protein [Streptosporangium brasiliense]MDP9868988.1 hypothetical protein [Streptosporangium brasiliense]
MVRAVTRLAEGTRRQMSTVLDARAETLHLPVEHDGLHQRIWLQHRDPFCPCVEHALVAAPAAVANKIGPGFDQAWQAARTGPRKLPRAA